MTKFGASILEAETIERSVLVSNNFEKQTEHSRFARTQKKVDSSNKVAGSAPSAPVPVTVAVEQ